MPHTRNVKSLREICTAYVQNTLTNWFNKLVDEKPAESVTDLLTKEENEELNHSFMTILDLLRKPHDQSFFQIIFYVINVFVYMFSASTLLLKLVQIHFKTLSKRNRFLWCYLKMLITREHTTIYMETKEKVFGLLDIASKKFPVKTQISSLYIL